MATEQDVLTRKGRFSVHVDKPLSQLDMPNAKAYQAILEGEHSGTSAFALLCEADAIPRREQALTQKKLETEGGLRLLDAGKIYVGFEHRHRYALLYRMPEKTVRRVQLGKLGSVDPQQAVDRFVKPAVAFIKSLHKEGLTHRAIRPENFLEAEDGRGPAILGDCLSDAPGADQPRRLEPIGHAQCDPMGRGRGISEDDFFNLGTLLIELCAGRPIVPAEDEDRLFEERLDLGTFQMLAGRGRIPNELESAIRGLINDDPSERWGAKEVDAWLDGRQPAPKKTRAPNRAPRPMRVRDKDCLTRPLAAEVLAKNFKDAVTVLKGNDFDGWLRRGLGDPNAAKEIAELFEHEGGLSTDAKVARALMILDPGGPIRHAGMTLQVDGLGYMMASMQDRPDRRQNLSKIVETRLAPHWINTQPLTKKGAATLHATFDRLSTLLGSGDGGLGYERVMYEACPDLHCLSPMLEDQLIDDVREILPAMEKAAKTNKLKGDVVDNHILAFIAARHKALSEKWLRSLTQERDRYHQVVAIVRILSLLQTQFSIPLVPNLTKRIEVLIRPIVTEFKSRKKRKKLSDDVEKAAKAGMLARILGAIDDPKALSKDKTNYKNAVREHATAIHDVSILQNSSERMRALSQRIGEQVGAAVCGVVGSLIVVVILFDRLVDL